MGRVLIRDQYQAEHWVDEGQMLYEPWRSCEVIRRENDETAPVIGATPDSAGAPQPHTKKAASRPASDDKE